MYKALARTKLPYYYSILFSQMYQSKCSVCVMLLDGLQPAPTLLTIYSLLVTAMHEMVMPLYMISMVS